jgi:hypothetical protein
VNVRSSYSVGPDGIDNGGRFNPDFKDPYTPWELREGFDFALFPSEERG